MKILFVLLVLLGSYRPVAAQVDTLRHKSSIEAYLQRRYHYRSVVLQEVNSVLRDTIAVRPAVPQYWLRADFNHDGREDLFVAATVQQGKHSEQDVLLVLASRHKQYLKVDIASPLNNGWHVGQASYHTYAHAGRAYVVLSQLVVRQPRLTVRAWRKELVYSTTHDTVFVRGDRPMLYAAHPTRAAIESVRFATTPCFGACPVFELAIGKDGDVDYKGIEFVHKTGEFKLRMPPADWAYLSELLANLQVLQLQDAYAVDYTDAPTAYLTVRYADGRTKTIKDYGWQGTYGLATLYRFLLELRNF